MPRCLTVKAGHSLAETVLTVRKESVMGSHALCWITITPCQDAKTSPNHLLPKECACMLSNNFFFFFVTKSSGHILEHEVC